jgi:hypothetical protein
MGSIQGCVLCINDSMVSFLIPRQRILLGVYNYRSVRKNEYISSQFGGGIQSSKNITKLLGFNNNKPANGHDNDFSVAAGARLR